MVRVASVLSSFIVLIRMFVLFFSFKPWGRCHRVLDSVSRWKIAILTLKTPATVTPMIQSPHHQTSRLHNRAASLRAAAPLTHRAALSTLPHLQNLTTMASLTLSFPWVFTFFIRFLIHLPLCSEISLSQSRVIYKVYVLVPKGLSYLRNQNFTSLFTSKQNFDFWDLIQIFLRYSIYKKDHTNYF